MPTLLTGEVRAPGISTSTNRRCTHSQLKAKIPRVLQVRSDRHLPKRKDLHYAGQFLYRSTIDGSHRCPCSSRSSSAPDLTVATVTKHTRQMESIVPSSFSRCTNCNVRVRVMVFHPFPRSQPIPQRSALLLAIRVPFFSRLGTRCLGLGMKSNVGPGIKRQ